MAGIAIVARSIEQQAQAPDRCTLRQAGPHVQVIALGIEQDP